MLELKRKSSFKKDSKKFQNNVKIQEIVNSIIIKLLSLEPLDKKYKNHQLIGDKKGFLEYHILPDLVLVYEITETDLILIRLCNHSELLKK